jgi:cold shock CspA family protein
MIGRVQKFSEMKGYGWLLLDFRTRIFFHITSWKSDTAPQVGMTVSFDTAPSRKPGLPDQAVNIMPVESAGGGAL